MDGDEVTSYLRKLEVLTARAWGFAVGAGFESRVRELAPGSSGELLVEQNIRELQRWQSPLTEDEERLVEALRAAGVAMLREVLALGKLAQTKQGLGWRDYWPLASAELAYHRTRERLERVLADREIEPRLLSWRDVRPGAPGLRH